MDFIITLAKDFVSGLLDAEEKFYSHPDQFNQMEESVVDLSLQTAARFLSEMLTETDQMICNNSKRKDGYKIHRHDQRTLITTAGDVTFTHTMFQDKKDGSTRYLLDEMLHLPDHERFSTLAEAKALSEAEIHSYQHAADSLQIGKQKVSKTAVMNKVHQISRSLPPAEKIPEEEKKQCEYLYIDADEDHIHSQKDSEERNGFIGKLIYLYEGRESVSKGRTRLIEAHYFSGLYAGTQGNAELWQEVQKYIEANYDTEVLKKVYISGDGGAWIKAGVDYIDRSVFVADRFHLMKYINRVSNYTLDERDITKGRFYKYIYKNKLLAAKKLLTRIQNHCEGSDKAVNDCRAYFLNNWDAIQRAFHDKHVYGCSAEGHISNVLSDRMSSRPMGWSETGSDRMCRLRAYVKNNGREKIIDLVRYRREIVFQDQQAVRKANGTDGMIEPEIVAHYSKRQREDFRYVEAIQATVPGLTARKTVAIREQIGNL